MSWMNSILRGASAVIALAPSWALAQGVERYWYGPHMRWGEGWYGMFFGPLFLILLLAAVVAAVVIAVRRLGGTSQTPPSTSTALDILKERFARGEIDASEFEERRRVLGA